ncbi:MAG: hypothetical protein HXS50_01020 [Theionarchaea archaeon]|nr:hypothetical protein [Theionarchaea archaeon]
MIMEWSQEATEFLESRREKLPGKAAEIDLALEKIRKDSEKAAASDGAGTVEKDHVKQAIQGLSKIEVVTEATEGSFAFVRVLVILGGIMLFVGLSVEIWYQNQAKYGDEPTEDVDIFILRYMLYVGIVLLTAAALIFVVGRRKSGEEWEDEEHSDEGEPGESEEDEEEGEPPEDEEGEEVT